jgi:hypothetical protein
MTSMPSFVCKPLEQIRLLLPSFLKLKMLVGCSAGEGDLARDLRTGGIEWTAQALKEVLPVAAKKLKTTYLSDLGRRMGDVRATQNWLNPFFAKVLPLLEPTRYDQAIQKFGNKDELL